ncbi:hypothetical protein ALI144C_21535 [Actinosynnema sp. ALI-1.44]|uniref:hypothetical protein n=1 Tax=Actinosynnema sp. ALI-1.44 TaxID=1933779 RepID=UPI00097C0D1A|nr:hypothetical protein [Actinosynnema sp. ALI-1.44]ONI81128.1 hypothetical protein ALI144C_21535 [Actinosynnema sp. ALI-1.44]
MTTANALRIPSTSGSLSHRNSEPSVATPSARLACWTVTSEPLPTPALAAGTFDKVTRNNVVTISPWPNPVTAIAGAMVRMVTPGHASSTVTIARRTPVPWIAASTVTTLRP